ncbi:MAG: response regulator [Rhodomicrobium sp.]|nr:response regulator [Rhodomicrobium sp.]
MPGHTLSNLENAQETAKRMGGKITLICGAREGPLIKFVLPLRHSPVDVPNPGGNSMHTPAAAAPRAAVAPYLILVAEDHPINLKLLLALLQAAGCETRCAENGREAVAMLDSTEFDLVVMDSQMPVMTGLEAIALIRSRTDWKRFIPILSLTANAMKGAEEIHTSAGADLYMSKPLRSDCFIGAVKDLARRGRDLRSKQADR